MAVTDPRAPTPTAGPGPGGAEPPSFAVLASQAPATPASAASQAATWVVVALAAVLVCATAGHPEAAALPVLVLTAGVLVGLATPAGRWAEAFPGVVAALCAVPVVAVVALLAGLPEVTIVAVPCFLVGVDWRLVSRLRLLPFLAGLAILVPAGVDSRWAFPAAGAWLVAALGALWLLHQDERTSLRRPAPLLGDGPPGPSAKAGDLARTLALAACIGLAVALLLGRPSCSGPDARTGPDLPRSPVTLPPGGFDPSGGDPDRGGERAAEPGEVPADRRLEDGAGAEGRGRSEREVQVGADGGKYVEDPITAERFPVLEDRDGTLLVRDAGGETVGVIRPDGTVVAHDGGDAQAFDVDDQGRLSTEATDGGRLELDETGGQVVLRDGDGRVVASGGRSTGHLVIADPDGDTVVPDPDGDGTIPIPNGAIRDALPGVGGTTTYRTEGDRTVATDADGEVRTYDQDREGRDRVTVETPGRPARTYVYDDDGQRRILVYDEDGTLIEVYRYDPRGIAVDGSPAAGTDAGGPGGGGADTPTTSPADQDEPAAEDGSDDEPFDWRWVAGGAAVVAAALVGWWLWRRRTPDDDPGPTGPEPWAVELAAAVEALGRAHGRPRDRAEAMAPYARALAASAVPDPRLVGVGEVLSTAFYARAQPTDDERAWAQATVAEVVAAHPAPGRRDRQPAPTG